jgi:hypothetical protein
MCSNVAPPNALRSVKGEMSITYRSQRSEEIVREPVFYTHVAIGARGLMVHMHTGFKERTLNGS